MTSAAGDRTGRVAVVSGGSRGLGRELVQRLLADGWSVATFSRKSGDFVERAAADHPDRFWWSPADLEVPEAIRDFMGGVLGRFGRLDLLFNNAGVLHQELLLTMSLQRITSLVTANLVTPMVLAQTSARAMSRSNGGTIVNISSINAVRGHRGVAVYSAAKAGLDGFTRSLAREFGAFNIRVNSVVPGFFDSEMTAGVTPANRERIQRRTPLNRLGETREIADAAMFVASPEASFITGQTIVVDGGITC